jgi:hypothetical protein
VSKLGVFALVGVGLCLAHPADFLEKPDEACFSQIFVEKL